MRRVAAAALLLAGACRAKPLDRAPDVEFPVVLQAPVLKTSMQELRGKAVVLDFWATWCGPCRDSLPHMNKLIQKFEGKDVRFLAVTQEDAHTVTEFTRDHPMKAWIGLDPDGAASRAFRVRGIPHIVVIDAWGRIHHRLSTTFFYPSDIEDALNAKAPEPAAKP